MDLKLERDFGKRFDVDKAAENLRPLFLEAVHSTIQEDCGSVRERFDKLMDGDKFSWALAVHLLGWYSDGTITGGGLGELPKEICPSCTKLVWDETCTCEVAVQL